MSDDEIPQFFYKMPQLPEELKDIPDRVSATFEGKTFFITGGSGFLGKVLIEKILRKSPNINKIYLLMRQKKGKDSKQRIHELFSSCLFDEVKKRHGASIIDKVSAIPGDVEAVNLGMSDQDRAFLQREVDMVIHAAATIRFDEALKKAVILNTRGTRQMMELAAGIQNLKLFVYVSTAYCHLDQKVLEEKLYPSPMDPHKVIKSCELMDEELVEKVGEKILQGFPNSYAFTKNLAEAIVTEHIKQGMPIIIVRPSIVIPTWLEPLQGWTDNINGPTGLLIGAGKGVIRTMYCDNTGYADYMPVDICINALLLAMWNFMSNGETDKKVYNLTSNSEWQVTWQQIIDIGREIISNEVPLNNAVWYPGGSMKSSRLYHQICVILFHMIPAYFIDSLIYLSGHKPILVKIQDRINKGFEVFEYYANNQWDFNNDNLRAIRHKMNDREKVEYKLDGDGMDLKMYFRDCILAARKYILKESPESIPRARQHMKMMYCLDLMTRIAFFAFLVWILVKWLSPLKSLFTLEV
uniref:Fatty acyl-CoA reductase n=1 Tax=Lygus hesperus TaxID=30085 RepID=A0A0A9WQG7_LYGHE